MQFFVTLRLDQLTSSPAELQSAMTEFVENELQAGSFVITGGLASDADGVRVGLSLNGMHQSEAPLPAHGFPVVEASSLRQAVEVASHMLRLHQNRPGLCPQLRGPARCHALLASGRTHERRQLRVA
jgi:hypothetical protein